MCALSAHTGQVRHAAPAGEQLRVGAWNSAPPPQLAWSPHGHPRASSPPASGPSGCCWPRTPARAHPLPSCKVLCWQPHTAAPGHQHEQEVRRACHSGYCYFWHCCCCCCCWGDGDGGSSSCTNCSILRRPGISAARALLALLSSCLPALARAPARALHTSFCLRCSSRSRRALLSCCCMSLLSGSIVSASCKSASILSS
mmetsp:Transcript_25645/g.69601  ORF Transcript_25645/g.69601 Transcript_25645/m.69601 type:complete len:200 (+) Transcript_25645:55-654(+)